MSFKISRKHIIGSFLCGSVLLLAGCASSPVDLGTITNPNKAVEQTVNASTLSAYKATMAALGDLQMSLLGDYHSDSSVEIKSRFADNEVAWVEITSLGADSCRITVRVGILANESRSRSVLSAIVNQIPNASAASNKRAPAELNRAASVRESQKYDNDQADDVQNGELKPLPKDDVGVKSLM